MFFPNLDGDIVDVFGRREDGCHGTAQKVGSSAAGLLAFGGWCSGGSARASCLFGSFVGRHFFERGGLVVVLVQDRTIASIGC